MARKKRLFTPVTLKMLHDAQLGPDDTCEIEGEQI